ncbi:hypothetical protein [Phenylobacterium immobile]|uniref:hypothetical protein n=1 Tax=Phenylobacterium immobile TaxID=21 RepID=UPI000B07727B|nr:hypothetical protein [Phenylobacterium immobile]
MTIRINDLDPLTDLDAREPAHERATDGALVYWMDPKPVAVGPAGVSAAVAAAFTVGAAAAITALALLHLIKPLRR